MSTEPDIMPTGVPGLDRLFCGGIKRGNLVLLRGCAGAGKSVLGMEIIYRGALELNEPGIIVVFETTAEMVVRDAASFGWDFAALQEAEKIKLVATSPEVLARELNSPDGVLMETAKRMNARRIFIDSIAALRPTANGNGTATPEALRAYGRGSYREALRQFVDGLRHQRLMTIVSHETGSSAEGNITGETAEFLADTVIELERGSRERGVYRSLEITKSRGQKFDAGKHTLQFTDAGLQIYRRVQAEVRDLAPQPASDDRRSAIGLKPLDLLTGGGFLDGSVTLIVGVSGAGKSILGYQIMIEGAKMGKPGLLITCDEHPAQVLRNSALVGLDLGPAVKSGAIELYHESPLELEVDIFYHRILEKIEKHKIERVVLDGMTTVINALNDSRVFREFIHGLIAFCKQRRVSVFLCFENPEVFGFSRYMPEGGFSSVVDNIILLSLVELGDSIHRALTIAKARGSAHSLTTHEYVLEKGGMKVLEGESRLPTLPFNHYLNVVSRGPTRFPQPAGKNLRADG